MVLRSPTAAPAPTGAAASLPTGAWLAPTPFSLDQELDQESFFLPGGGAMGFLSLDRLVEHIPCQRRIFEEWLRLNWSGLSCSPIESSVNDACDGGTSD